MLTINDLGSLGGIGFRHMLQDGLAIVRDQASFPTERRRYVLSDLADLFEDAQKGSDVFQREEYYFDPLESIAVRSFAFIERHLSFHERPTLSGDLATVCRVLRAINAGESAQPSDRKIAESVLQEVLAKVNLSGGVGLPEEPEDLAWKE